MITPSRPISPFCKILPAFITGILLRYYGYTSSSFIKVFLFLYLFTTFISYFFYQLPYAYGSGWLSIACYGWGFMSLVLSSENSYEEQKWVLLAGTVSSSPLQRAQLLVCDFTCTHGYDGQAWRLFKNAKRKKISWKQGELRGLVGSRWVVSCSNGHGRSWGTIKRAYSWPFSPQRATPFLDYHKKAISHPSLSSFLASSFFAERLGEAKERVMRLREKNGIAYFFTLSNSPIESIYLFLIGLLYLLLLFLGGVSSHVRSVVKKSLLFSLLYGWVRGYSLSPLYAAVLLGFLFFFIPPKMRRKRLWQSWSLAAFICLLRNPSSLLAPHFQFFYAITAAIFLVVSSLTKRNPFSARRSVLKHLLIYLITTGCSVQFMTLPLFCYHLGYIPTYFFISNLLLLPLFFLLTTGGVMIYLAEGLQLFPQQLTKFFVFFFQLFLRISSFIAALPGSLISCTTYQGDITSLLYYYFFFFLLLLLFHKKKKIYLYLLLL